ncbi:unnamed protein product [Rodentolepis nana]|uniref:AGC-kinase C-terminal domain-containing protein n=1 Tax=Rodentolepis nana TaxID=102285 RepID=A0A0R3T610_RODNA|nr:unnamed protein product [Rodentolepis nana]
MTHDNVHLQNPVTNQPGFPTAPPASGCCSRCWQAIFNCSKSTPPPVQREMRDLDSQLEGIDPPVQYPPVGSGFPAQLDENLDDGYENSPSEAAEDVFIKGLSKNDS